MKQNGWRRDEPIAAVRRHGDLRLALLAAAIIVASFATPVRAQGDRTASVAARSANLRTEPSIAAPVRAGLPQGEEVQILDEDEGDGHQGGVWYQVRTAGDLEGYLHSSVLTEVTSAPTVEPAQAPSMPDILDTADLSDEESAELAAEIRDLRAEAEAADDPDEAEDLRVEATELEQDLQARQQELTGEREEAAREAQAAELVAREALDQETSEAPQRAEPRAHTNQDWTGFYIGVSAGYGFGDEVFAQNNRGVSPEGDIDGFDGGVQLGYSYQFNRFVLGGEADYQLSSQSGTSNLDRIGLPGSSIEEEYQNFGSVRARAGLALTRVLLYATGGYAYLESDQSFRGPITDVVPDRSTDFDGWVIGAGIESWLAEYLSLKAEFLSHEVEDDTELIDAEFMSARVGLNWHF